VSLKLIARIMHEVELPRNKQLVLFGMAENADDNGKGSRPSVDRIAWKAGYKPRQVVNIMRDLEKKDKIIVLVKKAVQHRATEYDIHLEAAPKKMPFEEWRKLYGRNARSAEDADLEAEEQHNPDVQFRDSEQAPGVQSQDSDVQNENPGVQNGDSRSATANAPEPLEPSNEPLHEPFVGDPGPPTAHDLVTLFSDYLEEVREAKGTPRQERRPIPKTGAHSRGSFARDVRSELAGGRDTETIERAVRRRALRWDGYRLDLATAISDVIDGEPWTVEQERTRFSPQRNGHSAPAQRNGAANTDAHGRTTEDLKAAEARRKKGYWWLFGEDEPEDGDELEAGRRNDRRQEVVK